MEENETYTRLTGLQAMILQVYMPLMEMKSETRSYMDKFSRQINTSLQQAYGNVTIKVPYVPNSSDEEICRQKHLIEEYQNTIDDWTGTIKETLSREKDRQKEQNTAYGEVEYWRSKSATFNTLYQQLSMPQVKRIITIMEANANNPDAYSLDPFQQGWKDFSKKHAEAKDFVKFLTTLERQFKNIQRGDLPIIEETLPSLLNGLKLIWTISRHINTQEGKMEDLLESISNEICEKVRDKIDIKRIFKQRPDDAINIIDQGIQVLEKWQKQFNQTKMDIEQESTLKRWDFSKTKEIFIKPKYMKQILEDIQKACTVLKQFFSLLGPDLKAVTGSSEQIDIVTEKVKECASKLEQFPNDVFNPDYEVQWNMLFDSFKANITQIEDETCNLINTTFKDKLNSAEGAFDLLHKFKNIVTRPNIEKQMRNKYEDVLERYNTEVGEMKELFLKGKDNPLISKNMPPKAGAIAWARSIMGRIKTPIYKFKTRPDLLVSETGKIVTRKYIELAKQLDVGYEADIFQKWTKDNTQIAVELLKKNILEKVQITKDQVQYRVNFSPNLKVIIREAKFLDRIGKDIPQTITNIALQEKDYMRYVDKLNQLLRSYNSAMAQLKPVEKSLLEKQIAKLNKWMDKGAENHNWFSLSILEYIKECDKAISEFKEIKGRVLQHAQNIEKKVLKIEEAVIFREIDFERQNPMDITEFTEYFDSYRTKVISDLVKDYQDIGDIYLKSIEECTVRTNTQKSNEMRTYYLYWERRIFNAITKMIIRALATNKILWSRNEKPALIKVSSSYNHPEMTYHPSIDELRTQLEKITRNILDSTKQFGRWWDGFCKIFEERIHEETSEKYIPFTFYDDVNLNPVITKLNYDIVQCRTQVIEKFSMFSKRWTSKMNFKYFFDKNEMVKAQKLIDKNQSTSEIEKKIQIIKNYKKETKKISNESRNFFILVDHTEVKQKTFEKVAEWLNLFGNSLKEIASKELTFIIRDTLEYQRQLSPDIGNIESLKALLNIITEIKNKSMDMEFRINEVQENFRILKMYKFQVEKDLQDQVDALSVNWSKLVDEADLKDFQVNDIKKNFALVTSGEVLKFKSELKEEYERYISHGPGADNVSLDEGVEILQMSKDANRRFNRRREDYVLAEKLFNLQISKFPELINMEEQNKIYDEIYTIYKEHQQSVKEWSMMPWSKLDVQVLSSGAEKFEKQVKKFQQRHPTAEQIPPFVKLRTTINGFKDSLPLIQLLKTPAVQERHWKKIMEETGKDLGEINLKTITLSKVFELQLQLYEEKVNEICTEAKSEAKNEESLQKIESQWKNQQFDVVPYKKGNDLKGYALKAPDEIRQLLEDNILILQTLSASKYIRAIKNRVAQWEKDLNTINDVIDAWFLVQRKWMYLESIFASDDIRMQLPDEAKKFNKTDNNYKKIMEGAFKNPNVIQCCVKAEGGNRLGELKNISAELDKCQKSLTNYLDSKKMSFPRFYFISDDDLLLILGSSDPKSISPHLLKLFDNCKDVIYGKGDKQIIGMESDEQERYFFETPQKPEGKVEDWMNRIDNEMKSTLHLMTKKAVFNYAKNERIDWIKEQIGMVALVGTQIWWTFQVEDVFKRVKEGDKHAMKNELFKESKDLTALINLIRSDIEPLIRKSVNTLIILDVHARDIVDRFVRDSILDAKEFEWESQLRFYWDKKKDDIVIRQCTGVFDYCYEYQGLNGRLVITPLTDRCVMTLTTALTFKLGGAPAGPAGTGKTETVKDLAKSLALRCVVTNCGETLDYVAMGIIFSGLIQTGFWGCFDEFNRINPEVLSVVSAQIKTIQNGLFADHKKIYFNFADMRLINTVGIFVTMNPGYAGRSELPDNLKALFRPVTMVVPDLILICENMLMSEGFNVAKVLAKKMTVLYKLAREQLSKQYHYDFGLRALKSVLVMAGQLKRSYADLLEDIVLMRALRDMNMPKFVFEDVPLFYGLISDLFPGLKAERVGYEDLKDKIVDELEKHKYKHNQDDIFSEQVNKVIQLFETMGTRHTTMIVGPTGAGKSVVINTLAASLKEETGIPTKIDTINPKMVTLNELYGVLDPDSRDWTDGLLSKIFKEANQDQAPGKAERRWLVYDGDVDAVWVENMNSVMDDNRILTLANGDRIRLQKHCAMLFEVYDLQYASPATISRCGMVYVDPKNLGYNPFFERWAKDKKEKYSEVMYESLKELYFKYVPPCIDRIFEGATGGDEIVEPLRFITPRTNLNIVQQLATLIDSILPPADANPPQEVEQIERLFIFTVIWSLGGALVAEDREKFSEFVRNTSGLILPTGTLYDHFFELKDMKYVLWENKVQQYSPPASKKFSQILVPTVDTVRYSWLLSQIMLLRKPCMFVGDSGTAKTVTIFSHFKSLAMERFVVLNINFSSRTTSMDFQKNVEENIDKRSFKQYGPKTAGKQLIIFVDDLNMPRIDKYGTQQPIALLKFLVERNQLYQRGGDLELREIIDTQYVGSMTPPGGGNNQVDPRLMTLYSCFNITFPSKEAIEKIYTSILEKHVSEFTEDVRSIVPKVTTATLNLYFSICEKLPRTPVKFHYIFNLRDLSRVYEGLTLVTIDKCSTKEQLVRLWRNECMRVFSDRLINEVDRALVNDQLLPNLVKEFFAGTEEYVMRNPILFSDYVLSDPTDDEAEDPRLYEDLGDYDDVKKKMNKLLEDYGFENKPMNLVLFNDALEHVTKIHRIIRFPRGSGLLVGVGGSGKQSLTRLATFTACYDLFTINLVRNYREDDFREDLRTLYKEVLRRPKTFLFTDAHVTEEGFLELMNNILTIGMVPALFPEEEKDGLTGQLEDEMRKQGLPDTKEFRWQYFVNRCRDSIHIILAMSPAGDTLRLRCRNFPGLVSNTNIDWFFPWPEDALAAVASYFLVNVNLDEELRQPITDHIVMIHQSVQQYSVDYETIYKRTNFSTPKNYLDFINNYIRFLVNNRKSIDSQIRRLEGGLTTLAKAQEDTEILSKELAIKNAEIAEKKKVVEELISDITEKSEVAAKQQAVAAEKKAFLDIQSIKIAEEEAEASKALEEALPALEAAAAALKNIKPADITEIKSLPQPPQAIQDVCTICYFLYPKGGTDDNWASVKSKLLGDMQLLANLLEYDVAKTKSDQASKAKKKLSTLEKDNAATGKELQIIIAAKNKATGGLFQWVTSTIKCYDIYKDVEPKRRKAEEMKKQKAQAEKDLAETQAKLQEVTEKLNELNAKKSIKQAELDELEAKSREMQRKLTAASKLINGLGSEQARWTIDMEALATDKVKLVGDCLSGSAFLSYCGPFNYELRKKMVYEHWKTDLQAKGIPSKDEFRLEKFLTNDVEMSKWASEGLPGDELSIQNGILTKNASRWPLCIDPQMQAVVWIKDKEKKSNLEVLTFNMGDYIKKLEIAINFGKPVLFEAIDEEIDPMIDPILEKNIIVQAGVKMIKLGDSNIEYNDDFRLYMTTKIANPNYTPEIYGKTMIINFNVTLQGLRDQLLNEVVGFERPELEKQRKQLVIETSLNKAALKELEDTLLSELSKETDIPLVDNVPLIETLENAKGKAVEISLALENAKITEQDINQSREAYKDVAKRGAILFFAMQGLSAISEMYEYSLSSYLTVFKNALETARKDNILQNRLRNIKDKLTQLVYEFTCMGIFEKHKLMFSFQMTTMIMDGDNELNKVELDFFLKGNTSLDAIQREKPYPWMSNNGWKDMMRLVTLGEIFKGLTEDVESHGASWKEWYDLETPENATIPCGYSDKLNKFQQLLIIKIFRPDRVVNAIKNFIIEKMHDYYVKSPPIRYDKIYEQSTEKTPIVFILSPGADPQSDVQKLVEQVGIGMNKFKFLALGQGMGEQAKLLIEGGAMRGHWVMLQNCHLLVSWLKKLEQIIEGITKPDKNFRLWLTTAPTDRFPLGILQRSLKVVTEPPDGLGQNIKQSYSKLNDEMLQECPTNEFKSLVYVLAFFHAVIQERKKFGKIGWNVNYDFNESDFRISFRLISLYLNKAHQLKEEDLPWDTLRYLIGEAMYGGRVTDDFDRRVLNTYLKEYLGDFIFDSNQRFYFSKTGGEYVIPECQNLEQFIIAIDQIPLFTSPGVFGLHPNAEIQYFTNSAKEIWLNTIEMQTSDVAVAGGINKEEYIDQVATEIQSKLPEVFDYYNIRKSIEIPTPTQVVLLQELERFNKLIEKMHTSLFDLKRALLGEIGMSTELEELGNSLFNGFLPGMWSNLAPQTLKNLVNWMDHFQKRYDQYKEWNVEEPRVMWLSGLHIPESYLTALVQTTCRSKGWALDKSTLYTLVTKIRNPNEIKKKLEHGCFIQGIFLEGAKWQMEKDCLDYQNPKELIVELPLIQIVPIEANKLKLRGTIRTPVYVTQARRNAMGVGLVFEADLKTDKHASHWVLQGVCCVLNTD